MEDSLYRWQEECLERWLENGGRGTVQAVTGSGKTRLALNAVDALERKLGRKTAVKIVVPTQALMRQWAKALREHLAAKEERKSGRDFQVPEERIGLRGGGRKDASDCRYMIYVIHSARYELARQILTQLEDGQAVFLIADECHHYASGENRLIFEFLTRVHPEEVPYYSLGLSATLPSGEAGRILTDALGPRIYSYGMEKASAMETVCPFDIFHVALSFQEEEREEYQELSEEIRYCYTRLKKMVPHLDRLDQRELFERLTRLAAGNDPETARLAKSYMNLIYRRKSLVCLAGDRLSCGEDLIRRLDRKDKILVFGERIAQAEELYRALYRRYPGRVGRCHSQMGEQANQNNLERFRTGEFRILITYRAMDEGVDIPDASVGIILSGTSAQRQRTQRLGRLIRKKKGKERAALYYLHIEESAEDACYLPAAGESRMAELTYRPKLRSFVNPGYDPAARQVLKDMRQAHAGRRELWEAFRCLDLGRVRGDWMREPEEIEKQLSVASPVEERNYWICMKKVAEKSAL